MTDPLAQFERAMDRRGLALRTRRSYRWWMAQLMEFHHPRPVEDFAEEEVTAFLIHLNQRLGHSRGTLRLARAACRCFLEAKRIQVEDSGDLLRIVPGAAPSTIVEPDEFAAILAHLPIREQAIAALLYGAGLKLEEALRLQVADVDLGTGEVKVRNEAERPSHRSRINLELHAPMVRWLRFRARLYERDVWWWEETGLPNPFEGSLGDRWQRERVFATMRRGPRPRRNVRLLREGIRPRTVQRAISEAVQGVGANPAITPIALRSSFAVLSLRAGLRREVVAGYMGVNPRSLYHYERLLQPLPPT